jgi:hypothetical protein
MGNVVICNVDKMFNVDTLNFFFKKRNIDYVALVIYDINCLLGEPHFDQRYVMSHLLNKMCQITQSEYGFIGSVLYDKKDPYLQTHAISNIAWNSVSHDFLQQNINGTLVFENLETLVGDIMLGDECIIINKYDAQRKILPKGHPLIKRFMGVPYSFIPGRPIIMVGLCNKIQKFSRTDNKNIKKILNVLSYLLVDITKQEQMDEVASNKTGSFSEVKHELNEEDDVFPVIKSVKTSKRIIPMCNRKFYYEKQVGSDAYIHGLTEEIENDLMDSFPDKQMKGVAEMEQRSSFEKKN